MNGPLNVKLGSRVRAQLLRYKYDKTSSQTKK